MCSTNGYMYVQRIEEEDTDDRTFSFEINIYIYTREKITITIITNRLKYKPFGIEIRRKGMKDGDEERKIKKV